VRAFLDASVFIFAVERPTSNSAKLVKEFLAGRLEAVVDEEVLAEVGRFFRSRRGRSFAWLTTEQIRRVARVVSMDECRAEFETLKGQLKEGDRFHLAATRATKTLHLIALDEDFERFKEYLTPKEAVRRLGIVPGPSEW